jgi:hypothetical protein
MSMKRCDNGHYFDSSKYSACPSCGIEDLDIQATMIHRVPQASTAHSEGQTARLDRPSGSEGEPGVTVGVFRKKMGIDPVVGWLVCIAGGDKGRDFRIRSERNSIGRATHMDICLSGDDSISREKHAYVSYNPRKNSFLLTPGESRGIVYLNDEEVATPMPIKPFDVIELGQSKLLFVPFCGEQFQWDRFGDPP